MAESKKYPAIERALKILKNRFHSVEETTLKQEQNCKEIEKKSNFDGISRLTTSYRDNKIKVRPTRIKCETVSKMTNTKAVFIMTKYINIYLKYKIFSRLKSHICRNKSFVMELMSKLTKEYREEQFRTVIFNRNMIHCQERFGKIKVALLYERWRQKKLIFDILLMNLKKSLSIVRQKVMD